MDYVFYIASALGAVAVWLLLPTEHPKPARFGALLGVAAMGMLGVFMLRMAPDQPRPDIYYYIFSFIAIASAVRVITHPRPVYAALFFVLVVLAVAGMFIILEAEFMAFAMVIIYAGAILVTYLFVIMLATMPETAGQPLAAPLYDRVAREPVSSTVLGFGLLAVLASVMFSPAAAEQLKPNPTYAELPAHVAVVQRTPGRIIPVLQRHNLLPADVNTDDLQLSVHGDDLIVQTSGSDPYRQIPLTDELRNALTAESSNIDRVGVALFEGHTLGIELAGVILLLSMVGAIVIGRKRVAAGLNPEP